MNILILGGSNSLMKNGYVQHLEQSLAARGPVQIHQLSVGATSSLAAIGRLFDTAGIADVDVILFEYAINDAGHYAGRPDGGNSWLLCLHLLVKTAAQLYPDAVLVPLLFSMRRYAPPAVTDPFYNAQVQSYEALGVETIDIRRWLAELFLDQPPAWLYGDEAHYVAPYATAMIACEIARRLPALARDGQRLSATWQRMERLSPHGALQVFYVPGTSLQQFASGPVEPQHDSNRLMRLNYLRMHAGSRLALRTEMFPLVLYLKSDAGHHSIRLSLESEAVNGTVVTSTRHSDTGSFRFICSNLPVPLLFGHTLAVPFGPSALEIAVPQAAEAPPAAARAANFDCFGTPNVVPPQPYFDLCGILFVARTA